MLINMFEKLGQMLNMLFKFSLGRTGRLVLVEGEGFAPGINGRILLRAKHSDLNLLCS